MGLFDKFKAYLAEEEEEPAAPDELEKAGGIENDLDKELDKELAEDVRSLEEFEEPSEFGDSSELEGTFEEASSSDKKGSLFKRLFGRRKAAAKEDNEDLQSVSKDVRAVANTASIRASEIKAIQDFCEQLADVSAHMNEISREYALVTRYLTDIQRIEELPVEMANELIDIASKIQTLDTNRQNYIQSKNLLPPEQYNLISTYETEIVEAIKNLYDMEMRDGILKNDMGFLEGEKEDLKYMREEYSGSISKIRGIIITILIMFLLTNVMLIMYAATTRNNVTIFSLVTGLIAVVAFAISFLQYQGIRTEFRMNEAKLKRAVSLQNKVKAKYINNVNTVDYIYDKYGVSSAKELEYRWIQYNTMVQDAEKYNKTNNNLKRFCDELIIRLERIGVEDPDVWTKQITALIDRREMVEIKHSLNQRRQKLRENMVTCDKIKSNAVTALKAATASNPGMEDIIKTQLSPYGIGLE